MDDEFRGLAVDLTTVLEKRNAEIASLRAENAGLRAVCKVAARERDRWAIEASGFRDAQERIRDEAFQLGRQASWDEAQEMIKRLEAELAVSRKIVDDWSHGMGFRDLAELSEFHKLRAELAARQDAERYVRLDVHHSVVDKLNRVELAARQDAEEIARLKEALKWYARAVVTSIHPDSPGHCDDGRCARSTLAGRPQPEVHAPSHGPFPGAPFSPPKGDNDVGR